MTAIDPTLLEQLCAWMDGELPADEARFLQRRLEHDPALRAQWERWQLASACLRGQRVRLMPASSATVIAAAVDREPKRTGRWPWLAAAAAVALVAVLLPGPAPQVQPSAPLALDAASSPRPPAPPSPPGDAGAISVDDVLPSVSEFPLTEAAPKPWPRSPLVTDQQQLEAYLVRHNTLMAQDGIGGFMPYVDVVAHDAGADSGAQAASVDDGR